MPQIIHKISPEEFRELFTLALQTRDGIKVPTDAEILFAFKSEYGESIDDLKNLIDISIKFPWVATTDK